MQIFHVLDKIENAIYNSRKVPLFSNYALIRKDKILNLIEKTRQSLPQEMKQARWVTQENQRIIQEAQAKAGEIIRESEKRSNELVKAAKEESRKLLDKELIVVNAKARAEEILTETQKQAESILLDARQKSTDMLRVAEAKSLEMTYRAKEESEMTRTGADDYALKLLTSMEAEFTRILTSLKKSKDALLQAKAEEAKKVSSQTQKKETQAIPRPEPAKEEIKKQ